jgi:capsid protein
VHVIDPVDAGQLRGVSRFPAAIVKLFLLDQYDDAELDRKKVAAMQALFITTPAPAEPLDAAEGRDENDERTIDLQPGQITMLEPGEEVQTSAPADSGQTYEPFQYRTLLQVSAALGVPYALMVASARSRRRWPMSQARCRNALNAGANTVSPASMAYCASRIRWARQNWCASA